MDQQNGNTVFVRNSLECRQVTVVVGVGVVIVGSPNHLECVDDDQYGTRVLREKNVDLLLQPSADESALDTEVDSRRSILCDLKQPVLDAEGGVFQAEVECCALSGSIPQAFSPFATITASHSANHDFPTFGEPARMCRPWESSVSTTKLCGWSGWDMRVAPSMVLRRCLLYTSDAADEL